MTCREFKHNAASFSLRELVQQQDAAMVEHLQNCSACEVWMETQRSLNASLHTLRVRTAGLEAGPDVEGALLRVFRQGIPAAAADRAVVAAPAGMKERMAQAAPRSTRFALPLSRWFELGAYAAVAALIAIAVFLGLHLVRHGHTPTPVEAKSMPATHAPAVTATASVSQSSKVAIAEANIKAHPSHSLSRTGHVARQAVAGREPALEEAPSEADSGYMALMLCDPLSCASETQVVRMELPDASGTQPQVADLVVGYDGVVRAVRFVN